MWRLFAADVNMTTGEEKLEELKLEEITPDTYAEPKVTEGKIGSKTHNPDIRMKEYKFIFLDFRSKRMLLLYIHRFLT